MTELVLPTDGRYAALRPHLAHVTDGLFPIHAIIAMPVTAVEPIVAPSYRLLPDNTDAAQVVGAMLAYGVMPSRR